jgi:hypothetical protein
MAIQTIERNDIFGRIGKNFGEGLSEQIPKEVDQKRLSQGLKKFAAESGGRSNLENFAELASIYGSTPQLLQTFGDLAKAQNIRNIYGNNQQPGNPKEEVSPQSNQQNNFKDVQFANLKPGRQGSENIPSNYQNEEQQAIANQGVSPGNPLEKQYQPIAPWSQQRVEDEIGFELNRNPNLSLGEAKQLVSEKEARERSMPEFQREARELKKATQAELDSEVDKQLSTILQKEGKEIYSDLTGDTLLRLKKKAYEDLSTNPNLTEKTAAEKWIRKGKNLSETKSNIKSLAYRDISDRINPKQKEETLKRLMSAEKIFSETGNRNEFFDILRSKNTEDGGWGFDLSPGGAALIAYKRSDPVKKLISSNTDWGNTPSNKLDVKSRKFAQDFSNEMRSEDSILAVAREMKQKNRFFDETAFFDYFRENQDELGLTPHMKQELTLGVSDLTPNWGDIALFPAIGRSVAND